MRFLVLTLAVLGYAGFAQAEDDFGARFNAQAPAALQEEAATTEAAPEAIEPASGDDMNGEIESEADSVLEAEQPEEALAPFSPQTDEAAPVPATP